MDILKGNFDVKKKIKVKPKTNKKAKLKEYRERASASVSGSMVYIERDMLSWDGD